MLSDVWDGEDSECYGRPIFSFKENWICTTTITILESLAPFRNTLYLGLYQRGYDKMYHIMSSRCLAIFRPVEETTNYITEQIYV